MANSRGRYLNLPPGYMDQARSLSQQAAPGAEQRGSVQNAALAGALDDGSERGTREPTSGSMPVGEPSAANPTGGQFRPPYTPQPGDARLFNTGYGTPESGYGPGGVTNPAFQGTTVASGATVHPGGSGTLPDGTQVASQVPGQASASNPTGGTAAPGGPADQAWRASLQYGNAGRLSGFRTDGYGGDLKASTSMKNTYAKIASKYPSSPEGVRAVMNDPDFKRAFPNAVLIDHPTDPKIDFRGQLSDFESGVPVGVVDVLAASGQGGWQWLDEANDGAGGYVPAGGGGGGGGGNAAPASMPGAPAGGGDYISQLLAYLTRQMAMDQALR